MRRPLAWLGLTPEPERELPAAVARLRGAEAAAEQARLSDLLLRGTQRQWLRYLAEVTDLVTAQATQPEQGKAGAARHAAAVVLEHHRMLIGLDGRAYERTAHQRQALVEALRLLGGDHD